VGGSASVVACSRANTANYNLVGILGRSFDDGGLWAVARPISLGGCGKQRAGRRIMAIVHHHQN
jgi:hypothetical protein